MLTTQSAAPDPVLRPFVQWYVQREMALKAGEVVEPVFPRAGAMLIFQFAAIYEVKEYETEQLRRSWAATVIGPIASRRTRLILRDQVQSLDVLFRPLGMFRLFGVPVSSLTGGGTDAHSFLGMRASSLYEQLGNAGDFAERVRILNSFFLQRLQNAAPLNATAHALRQLSLGRCNVGGAAAMIGISERQLERRSLEYAGVSPKMFARISRFQRAIRKHRAGDGNWLAIAHEAGYYDQMHLIRDFHLLGGGAPTDVMNEIEDGHLISFACR